MRLAFARTAVALVMGALVTVTVGCGSSPEPVYYAMAPARGTAQAGWAHLVQLRRPALAGYLDRAEIVSRVTDYRLRVVSGESWSEPLGDMIGRILGVDLADRLPGSIVFTEASPISAAPEAIVSLDIQRFDVGGDGDVSLVAEITVEKPPTHVALGSRRLQLHAHPAASTTAALVATMSALLGQVADEVAVYLRSGAPPGDAHP
jgi:uncharacterized lipoprotein YmbA